MATVAAIVLAAGGSVRMRRPKQLLTLNGRTLLRRAAETTVAAGCKPVIVVLGCEADRMAAELTGLAVHPVTNPGWERGIGTSIRRGVEQLLALSPEPEAAVLLLCDQPGVTPATVRRLMAAHDSAGKPVCAAAYDGAIGPPVLVARALFGELLALPDDRGAKALWAAHPEWVFPVACPEAADDVDTPADYQRLASADVPKLE